MRVAQFATPVLLLASTMNGANYSAQKLTADGIEIVRLSDAAHKTDVSIVPSIGNTAYEMNVNGKNVLWSPYKTVREFKAKPAHLGVPFLAPWANRLDGDSYFVNGKQYNLNPALKDFSYDGHHKPIHGLLIYTSEWKVTSVKADDKAAEVTSTLELLKSP